ncbi:hypothetical protein JNM05_05260 [bacterium]|nr:hypothetical protein [bacterium]
MPKMPTVNAKLTIPLTNEHYDIYRLKKDLENKKDSLKLAIVSDSVLLTINHNEHVQIGDNLDTDPTVDSTDGLINDDLKLRDSTTTSFSLGVLGPASIDALANTNVIIPVFSFPQRSKTVTFAKFTGATILNGSTIKTTVTNNTQVGFDSLMIVIIGQNNARLDSFKAVVSSLGDTDTRVKTFTSTTTVTTPFTVRAYGHSTGSGSSVLVDTSLSVSIKMVVDITGSSITGRFPSQVITRVDSFKTSSNSVIDSGYISSGKLTLNFTKTIPVNATVLFTSEDFDSAGQSLTRSIRVTNSTAPVILLLNKWRVVPKDATIGNQYLDYNYTYTTDSISATGTPQTMANGQGIKVLATLDTMKFSRLRATLAQEQVDLDRSTQSIDIKHLDSIQIKRAFFEIITDHRISFPMSLDVTITGKRLPNITRTARIIADIPPYTSGASQQDTVRTTNYDEVADLLSILPDSIIVTGMVFVGDDIASGVVNRDDFINAQINLRAPLVFKLFGDSTSNLVKTDPSKIDISENQKQKLYDRLKSISIKGKIRNHFPVPISVQFFIDSSRIDPPTEIRFYDSTSAVKFTYPYAPLLINKGITNAGGIVTSAEEMEINYELDQSEYQRIFDSRIDSVKASIYRGLKVKLLNTGGFVQVSSDDFIDVNTDLEFEFFIDEHIND